MARATIMAIVVVCAAACGGGDDEFCVPQGRVNVGAAGTVGEARPQFADCYSGTTPVVSLGGARTATATDNSLAFDDEGLEATIDAATCRISITYVYDSMLSDDTPATGTLELAASPAGDEWSADPAGTSGFEWENSMGNTNVCGNDLTDVVIAVEAI